ncbi:protein of unknown function [Citrobacter freundii]|nr:protein of unknown function [Citrobacter freundii]
MLGHYILLSGVVTAAERGSKVVL